MIRSTFGLLSLCAVMLGAMAISASSAQAALYTWVVLDAGGAALESLKAELINEPDSKDITLLTHVAGLTVAITCTNFKLSGINLEAQGKLTSGGRALFEGCEAYGKGSLEEPLGCHLHTPGTGSGTIETGQLKGELVLHELGGGATESLAKIEPKEGTTFAAILTEKCILPEANTINGTLFLKDGEKKSEAHLAKHLIETGPLTSLWIGEDSAEHLETSIDGSAWVSLGGSHKGLLWADKRSLGWPILNSSGTIAVELKALILGEKDTPDLTLLTKFEGEKLALTCTNFELAGVNLEAGGRLTEGGKVVFTGCEFYGKGSLEKPLNCKVHTTGKATGTIETNALKGELVLHELAGGGTELLTKIEPKEGNTFATVLVTESETCWFEEKAVIRGKLFIKDCSSIVEEKCENKMTSHLVKHLIVEGPLTSLWVGADSKEHLETSVDGGAWVKLGNSGIGEHQGLKWAGILNV